MSSVTRLLSLSLELIGRRFTVLPEMQVGKERNPHKKVETLGKHWGLNSDISHPIPRPLRTDLAQGMPHTTPDSTALGPAQRYLKVDIEKVKWSIDRDRANTSERALLGKKGICMSAIACVGKKFDGEEGRKGGHA